LLPHRIFSYSSGCVEWKRYIFCRPTPLNRLVWPLLKSRLWARIKGNRTHEKKVSNTIRYHTKVFFLFTNTCTCILIDLHISYLLWIGTTIFRICRASHLPVNLYCFLPEAMFCETVFAHLLVLHFTFIFVCLSSRKICHVP